MARTVVAEPGVAERLRAIIREAGTVVLERDEVAHAAIVCLLARVHCFILGPPGTGKSTLIEFICTAIRDARYGRWLLDKQMGKEELFNEYDIAGYEKTGELKRDLTDSLAAVEIAFLDEIYKAGPANLTPILEVFEGGRFKNGRQWVDAPLISGFGASNEMPDDELAAISDRFSVRLVVEGIVEAVNFITMLNNVATRRHIEHRTNVTLAELAQASMVEVPAVVLPPGVAKSMLDLQSELKAEGIVPSDRRWSRSVLVLQACAWLDGRDAIEEDDLAFLRHVLWDTLEEKGAVTSACMSKTGPFTRAAMEIDAQLLEVATMVNDLVSNPQASGHERASVGSECQFRCNEADDQIADLIAKAAAEKRPVDRFEALRERLVDVRTDLLVATMSMGREAARTAALKGTK